MRLIKLKRFLLGFIALIVIALVGVACTQPKGNSAERAANARNESNQTRLVNQQKSPALSFSNERANLIKRYTTFNDPNKIGYIYELSQDGKIVDYSDVKGKLSNLSSQLDPENKLSCLRVDRDHVPCGVISESEPDGSYSGNGDGVFWFDTRGVYHEWKGYYEYTDQPRTLTQQPLLIVDKNVNGAAK